MASSRMRKASPGATAGSAVLASRYSPRQWRITVSIAASLTDRQWPAGSARIISIARSNSGTDAAGWSLR